MSDLINHPAHYIGLNGVEAWEVIHRYQLGYELGNAFKYLSRAGKKGDAVPDLRKARVYMQRWLDLYTANEADEPCALEGTVDWLTPDQVAEAFGLPDRLHDVMADMLEMAAFSLDGMRACDVIADGLLLLGEEIAEREGTPLAGIEPEAAHV